MPRYSPVALLLGWQTGILHIAELLPYLSLPSSSLATLLTNLCSVFQRLPKAQRAEFLFGGKSKQPAAAGATRYMHASLIYSCTYRGHICMCAYPCSIMCVYVSMYI